MVENDDTSSSAEWASLSAGDEDSEEAYTSSSSDGDSQGGFTWTEQDDDDPPSALAKPKTPQSIASLLAERETGGWSAGPTTPPQAINRKLASHFIPGGSRTTLARNHDRGYLVKWSADGRQFATAWQGSRLILLHDHTRSDNAPVKTIHCRTLRWTVTDLAVTRDSRFLAYTTIAPVIHLASIDNNEATSIANVTDIHDTLYLGREGQDSDLEYGEGVWSVRWSPDAGRELLCGSSSSVYIVDMTTQRVTKRLRCHQDDVNAVEYADERGDVFFSGSDDSMILAYDARVTGGGGGGNGNGNGNGSLERTSRRCKPIGGFVGHLGGITYLDSDGSGRWLLSQSKDQTAKLWDMRCLSSFAAVKSERTMRDVPALLFDYRWQGPPRGRGSAVVHPRDGSVVTYRGHQVLQTLIRAKFSSSRDYVYSGSACGSVYIWDRLAGGEPVRVLEGGHDDVVRDVAWHPSEPAMVSVGFDGQVVMWDC